jgi:hypothetical protein
MVGPGVPLARLLNRTAAGRTVPFSPATASTVPLVTQYKNSDTGTPALTAKICLPQHRALRH